MSNAVNLPSWDEANADSEAGVEIGALARFIIDNEPAGVADDAWRNSLRDVLLEDREKVAAEIERIAAINADLLAALKALIPKGWADTDMMDHMPGIKNARVAIANAEGRTP